MKQTTKKQQRGEVAAPTTAQDNAAIITAMFNERFPNPTETERGILEILQQNATHERLTAIEKLLRAAMEERHATN